MGGRGGGGEGCKLLIGYTFQSRVFLAASSQPHARAYRRLTDTIHLSNGRRAAVTTRDVTRGKLGGGWGGGAAGGKNLGGRGGRGGG